MRTVEEIVHIIPLGHEVDRAIKPFEKYKANRAYLLSIIENKKYSADMTEKQGLFLDVVKNKLEKGIQVRVWNVDLFDMLEVMKNIS